MIACAPVITTYSSGRVGMTAPNRGRGVRGHGGSVADAGSSKPRVARTGTRRERAGTRTAQTGIGRIPARGTHSGLRPERVANYAIRALNGPPIGPLLACDPDESGVTRRPACVSVLLVGVNCVEEGQHALGKQCRIGWVVCRERGVGEEVFLPRVEEQLGPVG